MPIRTSSLLSVLRARTPLAGLLAALVLAAGSAPVAPDADVLPALGAAEPPCAGTADDLGLAFEEVARALTPSVVSISSLGRVEPAGGLRRKPAPLHPFDLFGHGHPFLQPRVPDGGLVRQGLGSGFVVSADGYLLTNEHVVRAADEVTVTFADGKEYDARVVGTDPRTDVAVLKIDAEGLQPVYLGDSDTLRVGQWVAAIGNPFGLSSTMTSGIVSAVGRSRVGLAEYEDFVQTDAAINPGNSGGPLVNLRGEVVGINTAIFTRSGGSMGIGFAIPMNMARTVMESLIETGRVERGWLGVAIQDLDEGLARSFGYEGTAGALVGDVTPNGPAETAGLRPGDIVVRFGERTVEDVDDLRLAVAETRPGTRRTLELFREGELRTVEVEIGRLEADVTRAVHGDPTSDLGLAVRTLTPEIARMLNLATDARGVVVTRLEPHGPAARAGLRRNDVIVEVDGEEVEDVAAFERGLRQADLDRGVRITVTNGTLRRFVFLRAGE